MTMTDRSATPPGHPLSGPRFRAAGLWLAGVLLLAGPLWLTGCGRGNGRGTIMASGHVEATEVRIATKAPGHLLEFTLHEGDRITAGQVIARVDTVVTSLALLTAEARLAQAEADYAMKQSGSRREDVRQAEAQLASAEANLAGARRDLDRLEELLKSGSASTQQRDDARTRRDMVSATAEAAREALRRLQNGYRPEEIAGSRAAVEVARAQVAQYRQLMTDAVVTSPLSGFVTQKLVEPGELVAAGAALCVITNLDDMWLTGYVPGPDLARIKLGQSATVKTDDGQTRTGHVTYISPEAEFTPRNVQTRDERVKLVYRIKVGLPNADGLFKPGMPAEATLTPDAS